MNESMIRNMSIDEIKSNIDRIEDKGVLCEILLNKISEMISGDDIEDINNDLNDALLSLSGIEQIIEDLKIEIESAKNRMLK